MKAKHPAQCREHFYFTTCKNMKGWMHNNDTKRDARSFLLISAPVKSFSRGV